MYAARRSQRNIARILAARSKTTMAVQNHLIELLPRADRRALLAICEPVEIELSDVLWESGKLTRFAYFPIDATISLVTSIDGKPVLEVGMVGREGMVGAQLVLGVMKAPMHAVVQGSGRAWRIPSSAFRAQLARSPALNRLLHRYLYVLMSQLGRSAACLRFHPIAPRLARWLLMTQDRVQLDMFEVTHKFLAYMLGVRRVGITTAAGTLQRAKLIEYARGKLAVLNRRGLEAAACECYASDRRSYAELLA
jgi:CRP-like cAMP-binding protein